MQEARKRLIVALDVPSAQAAIELVDRLDGSCQWFKVGMELFTAAGPEIIETLTADGHFGLPGPQVPRHPQHGGRSCAFGGGIGRAYDDDSCRGRACHARRCKSCAGWHCRSPQLLAVTMLTSMDAAQMKAIGLARSPEKQVELLAEMGLKAGIQRLCLLAAGSRGIARDHGSQGRAGGSRNSTRRRQSGRSETLATPPMRCAGSELPRRRPAYHAGAPTRRRPLKRC